MKLRQLGFDLLIESVFVIFYLSSLEPCGKSFSGKVLVFPEKVIVFFRFKDRVEQVLSSLQELRLS